MYPGYNPTVVFNRAAPLSPIQKSFGGVSPYYDNRLVVVDASPDGGVRGFALPLKLDLARRTSLLHDDEISGATFDEAADIMMNSAKRDAKAAHPFFVADPNDRKALIEFMKSLTISGAFPDRGRRGQLGELEERGHRARRADYHLRNRLGVQHGERLHAEYQRHFRWNPGSAIDCQQHAAHGNRAVQ